VKKICKSQYPQEDINIVEDKSEEKLLFATSCVTTNKSTKDCIMDSDYTNHMTHDQELFKELNK